MYTLVWTAGFRRSAANFVKRHPELREKFAAVLRDLEHDPFQSHLQYHRLSGKLKDVEAVSVTDKYRITLTVVITEQAVVLLDIGSHDEVYR